jgi:hypothetical protein
MAYLDPELNEAAVREPAGEPTETETQDALEIDDPGAVTEADSLINTRGASLNYVLHLLKTNGPFCADRSSLRGED